MKSPNLYKGMENTGAAPQANVVYECVKACAPGGASTVTMSIPQSPTQQIDRYAMAVVMAVNAPIMNYLLSPEQIRTHTAIVNAAVQRYNELTQESPRKAIISQLVHAWEEVY